MRFVFDVDLNVCQVTFVNEGASSFQMFSMGFFPVGRVNLQNIPSGVTG